MPIVYPMADRLSLLRNLIVYEARRRKRGLLHGNGRINQAAIARKTGLSGATICRIMGLKPSRRPNAPESDYQPKAVVVDGIKAWLGFTSDADLWAAAEEAPPARPPRKNPK